MRSWGAALTVALIVTAGSTGAGAPAGAEEAPSPVGAPVSSEERFVRRLLFDLQDDGDPTGADLDLGVGIFFEGQGNPSAVAVAMQDVPQGRGATVDGLFEAILRRPADPAARAFFMDRLGRIGRQKVAADLLASAEYAATRGEGTEAGWVDALYQDALGRPADEAGRQYFVAQRQAGRTRGSIASFFTGGTEGRRALVRRLMVELLRRPADAPSVAFYADRLAAGWRAERVVASLVLSSEYRARTEAVPTAEPVVILRDGSRLVRTTTAGDPGDELAVTGLAVGEQVVAIDTRPSTGLLYGLTSQAQLVRIAVDGSIARIGEPIPGLELDGVMAGMAFVPDLDVVVVTDGEHRVAVVPTDGTVYPGGSAAPMAYAAGTLHHGTTPAVLGTASDAVGRQLALDDAADALVQMASSGTLTAIGPLHLDASGANGFDVSTRSGVAWALLDAPEAGPGLYAVDPASGEPRRLTDVDVDEVVGLAVVDDPDVPEEDALYLRGENGEYYVSGTTGENPGGSGDLVVTTGPLVAVAGHHFLDTGGQLYVPYIVGSHMWFLTVVPFGSALPGFDAVDGADVTVDDDTVTVVNGDRLWRLNTDDGAFVDPPETEPGTPLALTFATGDANAGATPQIGGLAGRGDVLYGVDEALDALVRIDPATGAVDTVGALVLGGIDDVIGFDISWRPGERAWLLVEDAAGRQTMATIDLDAGAVLTLDPRAWSPGQPAVAFALA